MSNTYPLLPVFGEEIEDYEKRIKQRYDDHCEFMEYAKGIADDYATAFEGIDTHVDSILFEDGKVYAEAYSRSSSCGCCEEHPRNFAFPVKYLWDMNWEQKEQRIRLEKNLASIRKREQEKRDNAVTEKDERRKQYETLKEEFEQEDMS